MLALFIASVSAGRAATFTIDSTSDAVDAYPGDGVNAAGFLVSTAPPRAIESNPPSAEHGASKAAAPLLASLREPKAEWGQGVSRSPSPAPEQPVRSALLQLPLAFELNEGQLPGEVRFLTRAPGYTLSLFATEAWLLVKGDAQRPGHLKAQRTVPEGETGIAKALPHALKLTWLGANPEATATAEARLPGIVNYLKGNDPAQWHTRIPTYERVRYADLYPGIDLVYYGNGNTLEYDLIVAPGADLKTIRFGIEGAEASLADSGDLTLALSDGRALTLKAPLIYQKHDNERTLIEGRYLLARNDSTAEIGFEIAAYDPTLPLVIDPLVYSTFLGGSGTDVGHGIAVNAAGEAFVTGATKDASADFPTTPGAYDTVHSGGFDVFVTRLNATGTALVYSTFLGGSGNQYGRGIAVNAANEAFVTGYTDSSGFPTTTGAYDTGHNGGFDVFVTRLNSTGTALVYSTLLSGDDNDFGYGIAINAANEAFVTGYTALGFIGFPTTAGAYDTGHNGGYDAFVTRLNATGTALVYSTLLGGGGNDVGYGIAVNAAGEAFVTGGAMEPIYWYEPNFPTTPGAYDLGYRGGFDAFVTRLNATGTGLIYSTLLGGGEDLGFGIAINAANEAFVTGYTTTGTFGSGFPPTAGAYDTSPNGGSDAFVARVNTAAAGAASLVYSTFLGGEGDDAGTGIAVNAANEAFVTGSTGSNSFPTTPGAYDTGRSSSHAAFVTRLNSTGTGLIYSTFLDGGLDSSGSGIAVNAANEAFVTGSTVLGGFTGFPTTTGAYDTSPNGGDDAFVTKMQTAPTLPVPTTANLFLCEAMPGTPVVTSIPPASAKPMAVTNPTPTDVRVVLQTAAFAGAVDVYVAARLPDGSTMIRSPTGWLPYPANVVPLRAMNTAAIDMTSAADNLYSGPLSALPPGNYQGNVIVVPTGAGIGSAAFYNWCYTKTF